MRVHYFLSNLITGGLKRGKRQMFKQIKKRDGRVVDFDGSKITAAIAKTGKATGEFDGQMARRLTLRVLTLAQAMNLATPPGVEEIQDIVDRVLIESPYYQSAKRSDARRVGKACRSRWTPDSEKKKLI